MMLLLADPFQIAIRVKSQIELLLIHIYHECFI